MHVETTVPAGPATAGPRAQSFLLSLFRLLLRLFRRERRPARPAGPARPKIPDGANGNSPDDSGAPVIGSPPR